MGVRTTWKLKRINELDLPKELKQRLIESLVLKQPATLHVFTADIKDGVSGLVFPTRRQAIAEWLRTKGAQIVLTEGALPPVIRLHSWVVDLNEYLAATKSGVTNQLPVPPDKVVSYEPLGRGYADDIQSSYQPHKP